MRYPPEPPLARQAQSRRSSSWLTGVSIELALSLFLALFWTIDGRAEVPLETYGQLPAVSGLAISPDGSRIAFRRSSDEMDAVIVIDRAAGEGIAAIDGSKTRLRALSFLARDKLMLYAAESDHIYAARLKLQISGSFIYDVRSNELRALLMNSSRILPVQTGFGRMVSYNSENDAVYMPAYVQSGAGRPPTYGLFEVTPSKPHGLLLQKGTTDTVDWFVDRSGRIIAQEEFDEREGVQRIWRWNDDTRILVYESGPFKPAYDIAGLGLDRQSLVVAMRGLGAEFNVYLEMNLDDGHLGDILFQHDGADIDHALMDFERRVHGVQFSGFFPRYRFHDAKLTRRVRTAQASLPTSAAYLVDWSPDFGYLIFEASGGWTAGAYLIVEPDSSEPQLLLNRRIGIPDEAVAPTSMLRYEAQDRLVIPALVTARADIRNAGNAPLIVLPHGGPEAYDRYGFDWIAQYFASRGIVVLQPQFRGSSGFGETLRRAGSGQWGAAMSSDLDDGVRHLVDTGLVDGQRVCMVGISYGGYAALAAGAFSPYDYSCLVSISGVSDLKSMLVHQRRLTGEQSRAMRYWKKQFGVDEMGEQSLDDASPSRFAENFRSPVLLVHGQADAIVPFYQSSRMHRALRRAKKEAKLVKLDGEDHYLSGYETRLQALRTVAEFIEKQL